MSTAGPTQTYSPGIPVSEIDASCRLPVLLLFLSSAVWLVIGSIFGLIASLKFHSPSFLAAWPCLTYGRVRPAQADSLLYGFCIQAGLAVALWLLARLGQARLAQPWLIAVGTKLWNLGVAIGILGILAGDATGYEVLDFPRYATPLLFLGYTIIGVWALVTFHRRRPLVLFPSLWFIVAGLLWFPWIYSSANLLLFGFPVRGAMQSLVAWWYGANLQVVWLGLVGLAAVFYFMPLLTRRELRTRELTLVIFSVLTLFGGWTGIPNSAPLPASMPALSTAASFMLILMIVAVALSLHKTLGGNYSLLRASPSLRFVGFGVAAFLLAGVLNVIASLPTISQVTDFTWFIPAKTFLSTYGFFAMVMFGAAYHIVPQLTGDRPSPSLGAGHFWTAAAGVLFVVVPLALGGIVQGFKSNDRTVLFLDLTRSTLPFLRMSTLGELLLLIGNCIFLVKVAAFARRFYRERATAAYAAATLPDLKPAGANA